MGQIRFAQPSDLTAEDYELPEREPIPEPGKLSTEEYAEVLGVGTIDPWEDPGSIHIFHILRDDLELLWRLLSQWARRALGPLEVFLSGSAGQSAIEDDSQRQNLLSRCRVARAWIAAWREGRGRPIDRGVLEACDVVSGRFIEEVSELTTEVRGDPDLLLERMNEISRWGATKTQRFQEWLQEGEYIDTHSPLGREQREARVLDEMAGQAEPEEIREVIRWLEAGIGDH